MESQSELQTTIQPQKINKGDGNKNNLSLWRDSAILFIAGYIGIFQFAQMLLLQKHGVKLAYTGFYWFFWIGWISLLVIYVIRPNHILTRLTRPWALGIIAYLSARFLLDEFRYITPLAYVINIVLAVLLIIVFLSSWKSFFGIFKPQIRSQFKTIWKSKNFQIFLAIAIIWVVLLSWSYVGFSQKYKVVDPHQENFKISFWGSPMGGVSWSNYADGSYDEELALYEKMHSSFYIGLSVNSFQNQENLNNLSAILEYYDDFNIKIIFNLNPYNEEYKAGDFVTVFYIQEINACLQLYMNWLDTLSEKALHAVRGFSLDVESPIYPGHNPSRDQYNRAIISYQIMFDEFKQRFPGKEVLLIEIDSIIFDHFDGDPDLDIGHQTFTDPPLWDAYGFMTYMAGSASPGKSSYEFAYYCELGYSQWGRKFQPWIGWLYNPESDDDPNVIENPVVYNKFMEQVKIAKSIGVEEVVIAPVRNFHGRNQTEGLQRLYDLYNIYKGFETFEIPITQDMNLIYDQEEYMKHVNPFTFYGKNSVFVDLMHNMDDNGPIFWTQFIVNVLLLSLYWSYKKKIIIINLRN